METSNRRIRRVMTRLAVLLACQVCLRTADAWAQLRPPNTIGGGPGSVTVQLPSFSFFTVSTSVLVPDRGAVYLGGVNRNSYSSAARGILFGPLANRGSASSTAAGGVSVSAWVQDFRAMDEALLAQAAAQRGAAQQAGQSTAPIFDREIPAKDAGLQSVANLRQQQLAKAEAGDAEAQKHFDKAQQLEAEGKRGVARIHYRMALRRASGSLKAEISRRLAALDGIHERVTSDR